MKKKNNSRDMYFDFELSSQSNALCLDKLKDAIFLIGSYHGKNSTYNTGHFDWIQRNSLYNIRSKFVEERKSIEGFDLMYKSAKYAILYESGNPTSYIIYELSSPSTYKRKRMKELGYESNGLSYEVYGLKREVVLQGFQLKNFLSTYAKSKRGSWKYGEPIFLTGDTLSNYVVTDAEKPATQHSFGNIMRLKDNVGFNEECCDIIRKKKDLKIGLIDADLLCNGTRHPNLCLLKISHFCKRHGHNVRLIEEYSEINYKSLFETGGFDLLVLSRVFKFTKIPHDIASLISGGYISYGGTGYFEINGPKLPEEVEHEMPDYTLYLDYIEKQTEGDPKKKKRDWDDYLSYSIGFTTRGCIRHCGFCVNRLLSRVEEWSPVEEFLDPTRPNIYLWDDNIMAAKPAVFKKVMDDLRASGKPFQFRQGMDIRLMTDDKAILLDSVRYHGDYIFAFDHYKMDDPVERRNVEQTLRGLEVWRRHTLKSTKLYVLVAYDSQDERDIEGAFFRIKKLMEFGCLPYIMRFEEYNNSRFKSMYTQLARWCNQPSFFKKMSFRQFCVRNEEYHQGIQYDHAGTFASKLVIPEGFKQKDNYCSCYQSMLDFEKEFPEIAREYFDLRFEDINPYKIDKG